MLEFITGIAGTNALGVLGILTFMTTIIVEVLKNIITEEFPTKLLTIIVSFVVTIVFVIVFCEISLKSIILGVFGSFIVSFVSMNGFDSLKDIYSRFKYDV